MVINRVILYMIVLTLDNGLYNITYKQFLTTDITGQKPRRRQATSTKYNLLYCIFFSVINKCSHKQLLNLCESHKMFTYFRPSSGIDYVIMIRLQL